MKTNVVKARKMIEFPSNFIPNGTYSGIWGGYVVEIKVLGEPVELTTKDGVRGINIPCVVTVDNNDVYVTTLS